jgi:hypothetical protein
MGIGIIVRDHKLLLWCNGNILLIPPLLKLWHGKWSSFVVMGLNNVLLEGDSLEAIQAMSKEESM